MAFQGATANPLDLRRADLPGGAPKDLNVLAARLELRPVLALRLIGEAIAVAGVTGVAVVAVATIARTGIIGAEAVIEESVAEAAMVSSVVEATTEPSVAEPAMEASVAEAAVEASAA